MSETNFQGPLSLGSKTGVPTTETRGFVKATKLVQVNATDKAVDVTVPKSTTITGLGAVITSAITGAGADPTSRFSFSAGSVLLGTIPASGNVSEGNVFVGISDVSGAIIDTDTVITVALSAQATSVFTGGGGRAFIEYLTTE